MLVITEKVHSESGALLARLQTIVNTHKDQFVKETHCFCTIPGNKDRTICIKPKVSIQRQAIAPTAKMKLLTAILIALAFTQQISGERIGIRDRDPNDFYSELDPSGIPKCIKAEQKHLIIFHLLFAYFDAMGQIKNFYNLFYTEVNNLDVKNFLADDYQRL